MSNLKKKFRNLRLQVRQLTSFMRKTPDFVIIGTQKGGTSSLFYYLSQHPGVEVSMPKEVHFFDLNYKKGLNWYKRHFPLKGTKSLIGEASPYYIFHPHVAARIKKDLPHAKIIMFLRDPVERAFSHYKMNKKNGTETLSFEEAVATENERLQKDMEQFNKNEFHNGRSHRLFSYVNRGFYDKQIENWRKYFSPDQMLILKSEDFFADTEGVVKQVLHFLGLEPEGNINYGNKNKGVAGKFDEATRVKLKNLYASQTEALQRLTGKKFEW